MPAQPLSEQQKLDAERLQLLWLAHKATNPDASQEKLAAECGWKTQGAVSQYMRGKIPLNLPALLKFSKALEIPAWKISPTLAAQIPQSNEPPQDYKQNHPLAHIEHAQAAIKNNADEDDGDLVAALRAFGLRLENADETTRRRVKVVLNELVDDPANATSLLPMLNAALAEPAPGKRHAA